MNEIDWSKAPEGATHYSPGTGEWYRVSTVTTLACVWVGRWSKAAQYEARATGCIAKPATTTPSWSGEGLPSVGVHVEWYSDVCGWLGGKVIGHDGTVAVVSHNDGYTGCHLHNLKPIRTPEQIEADEWEAAIDAMFSRFGGVGGLTRKQCAWVISEGYRKP